MKKCTDRFEKNSFYQDREDGTFSLPPYGDFSCLASACPDTCCRGWTILADPKAVKALKDSFPRSAFWIRREGGGFYHIRRVFGRCPFHRGGLCSLEKKGCPKAMPGVCRSYPRRVIRAGKRTELSLELSCIEAARLFLASDGTPLEMKEVKETAVRPGEVVWTLENDDPIFLSLLLSSRERIRENIMAGPAGDLPGREAYGLSYVRRLHRLIVRDRVGEAGKEPFFLGEGGKKAEKKGPTLFPISFLNDSIYTLVPFSRQIFRDKNAFRILLAYRRTFGCLKEGEAEGIFQTWYREMTGTFPGRKEAYRRYFLYCLDQTYLTAYEDYHVLRQYLLTAWYTDLFKLFDTAVYIFLKSGPSSLRKKLRPVGEEAGVLSGMEHAFRHSLLVRDGFLSLLREEGEGYLT